MFRITRADNCIWLKDERGQADKEGLPAAHAPTEIHFTPEQVLAVCPKLIEAAQAEQDYSAEV